MDMAGDLSQCSVIRRKCVLVSALSEMAKHWTPHASHVDYLTKRNSTTELPPPEDLKGRAAINDARGDF